MSHSENKSDNEMTKEQTQLEIDPKETETNIRSDKLSHVENWRGACAMIVNTKGKHFVAKRSLTQDQ